MKSKSACESYETVLYA